MHPSKSSVLSNRSFNKQAVQYMLKLKFNLKLRVIPQECCLFSVVYKTHEMSLLLWRPSPLYSYSFIAISEKKKFRKDLFLQPGVRPPSRASQVHGR